MPNHFCLLLRLILTLATTVQLSACAISSHYVMTAPDRQVEAKRLTGAEGPSTLGYLKYVGSVPGAFAYDFSGDKNLVSTEPSNRLFSNKCAITELGKIHAVKLFYQNPGAFFDTGTVKCYLFTARTEPPTFQSIEFVLDEALKKSMSFDSIVAAIGVPVFSNISGEIKEYHWCKTYETTLGFVAAAFINGKLIQAIPYGKQHMNNQVLLGRKYVNDAYFRWTQTLPSFPDKKVLDCSAYVFAAINFAEFVGIENANSIREREVREAKDRAFANATQGHPSNIMFRLAATGSDGNWYEIKPAFRGARYLNDQKIGCHLARGSKEWLQGMIYSSAGIALTVSKTSGCINLLERQDLSASAVRDFRDRFPSEIQFTELLPPSQFGISDCRKISCNEPQRLEFSKFMQWRETALRQDRREASEALQRIFPSIQFHEIDLWVK